MLRCLAFLAAAACLAAGCGEEVGGDGTAELWVTRDRGAEVVLTADVPAGISALEAVRREAEVETRYGGRFIHAIDGIEGDLSERHDWFWFVNGYEGDRSAAEYELRAGDVVWWDHRSWSGQRRQPVVVGSFPEPFLHGWGGKRRPAVVLGTPEELAERLAELVDGVANHTRPEANRLVIVPGSGFRARVDGAPGDPVTFDVGRETAERLLEDPALARYRYELP